jgi:hypothetical protein
MDTNERETTPPRVETGMLLITRTRATAALAEGWRLWTVTRVDVNPGGAVAVWLLSWHEAGFVTAQVPFPLGVVPAGWRVWRPSQAELTYLYARACVRTGDDDAAGVLEAGRGAE